MPRVPDASEVTKYYRENAMSITAPPAVRSRAYLGFIPSGRSSILRVSDFGRGMSPGNSLFTLGISAAAPPAPPTSVTYKYVKFTLLDTRGSVGVAQLSEFQLLLKNVNIFVGIGLANLTTDPLAEGGDGTLSLLDNNLNTKCFPMFVNTTDPLPYPLTVYRTDGGTLTFDAYRFATANDADVRDPVRWTIEGSNDNVTWVMLSDKSAVAQTVPLARNTYYTSVSVL